MIQDYINMSFRYMKERKLRTFLTILGIIVGVAAIVSLYSLGQGLEDAILGSFSQFGENELWVVPKNLRGAPAGVPGLVESDIKAVERVKEFELVMGILWTRSKVEFHRKEEFISVMAMEQDKWDEMMRISGTELDDGSGLTGKGEYTAVIGYDLANGDLFDENKVRLDNNIIVNGYSFRVIGIASQTGDRDSDRTVYIPLSTARKIFDKPEEINMIIGYVKPGLNVDEVAVKAEKVIERSIDDDRFEVTSAKQIQEQIATVLNIVRLVIVGIAAISLLVGAIGIMNSLFTSVLERTSDIGVMKAVGARNRDILFLFITESGVLGFVGGVLGVALGIGLGKMVELVAKAAGFERLQVAMIWELWVFAICFAVVIGIISGVIPSWNASRMKPVDALRYE